MGCRIRSLLRAPLVGAARRLAVAILLGTIGIVGAFVIDGARAQGVDRPPEGTASLFDRLVAQFGGVPFPFERLAETVASFGADAARPSLLLIPDGRSLVRQQTTFERPRVLLASGRAQPGANASSGTPTANRMFLGFAEDAGELEVISWNETAGRFEFQVVNDYRDGATPVVTYARRAFCFTCHQGEGPIFSRRPWGETNVHGRIADAIASARGGSGAYHAVPLKQPLRTAESFDSSVVEANLLVAAQAFWRRGCGGSPSGADECRRLLLAQAIAFRWDPATFDDASAEMGRLARLQSVLRPSGVALGDDRLQSREPPVEQSGFGWLLDWIGLGGPRQDEVRAELDPKLLRPPLRTRDTGVHAIAASLTPSDIRELQAGSSSSATLAQIIRQDVPPSLFADGPFDRQRIVAALAKTSGEPLAIACCDSVTAGTMSKDASEPVQLAAGSDLEPFARYCFSCHRDSPVRRLNFMRGSKPEEIWTNIVSTPKMEEVLRWERYAGTSRERMLMPPMNSREHLLLQASPGGGMDDVRAIRQALADRGY